MKLIDQRFSGLGLLLVIMHSGMAWGQAKDLDCTKCVDSSEIANGAVNGVRIKDGTVQGKDLASGAVTSKEIKDGTIKNKDIKNGAIGPNKLRSNAMFQNIIVIRTDPGDPIGNCADLKDALAMIDDANTVETLIKLEPGMYDCSNGGGSSNVVMKPFVDIEGSGQGVTTIYGDASTDLMGVIQTAANTELRFLTVENIILEPSIPHALYVPEFARFSFVTVITGGTGEAIDCFTNDSERAFVMQNSVIRALLGAVFECEDPVFVSTQLDAPQPNAICHGSFDGDFNALDNNCGSNEQ